jgi:MtN3 and saliva related transmembrane protein
MQHDTIIGITASVFTATALIPQLVKMIREKKSEDVSYLMLLVLVVGHCLWIYYGSLKEDMIIISSNIFGLAVDIAVCILTFKYKSHSSRTIS